MYISLIGMSGAGKTWWSNKLMQSGFKCFCCDDMIEKKLISDSIDQNIKINNVGDWLGFPYQKQYKEREIKYLHKEIEVLTEIFKYCEIHNSNSNGDLVIDTTGSVIYTGNDILRNLQKHTILVHLQSPIEVQQQMLKKYIKDHKPVLWNNLFTQNDDESTDQALKRCYTNLLLSREIEYKKMADISIDYYLHSKNDFQVEDFIYFIKTNIKK